MNQEQARTRYRKIKPYLDFLFALVLVILFFPLLVIIACTIKLDSPGPVFHWQQRVGLHQSLFKIWKFRTMTVSDQRTESQTLPNSSDITRTGSLLRRLKLDELPQIINVLWGDMSLVGPRPCLPSLLQNMEERHKERFTVKPGLTGLAQVNGNIYIDWIARFDYDLTYVQNISVSLDINILLKTVMVIVFGEKKLVK